MPPDLDIENSAELVAYLRRTERIDAEQAVRTRVLAGGVSNKTVLVEQTSGETWVLKQALAKLRVEADWFADPARIHREALGLRWLERLAPADSITPLVFEDEAEHILAMQAVPQPMENWKTVLLAGRVETDRFVQFARLLAAIHANAWRRRDTLADVFADRRFFESLRLEPYYTYAAAGVPDAAAFLGELVTDTRATRLTLVHGDYSPKNILLHARRMFLVDHEVIHWGDPAFDLGFALAHLLSKSHHVRHRRASFVEAAVMFYHEYAFRLGDVPWSGGLESRAVRHALGCLLARVAGRSPLEYLSEVERRAQQSIVVELMRRPADTVTGLAREFVSQLPTTD